MILADRRKSRGIKLWTVNNKSSYHSSELNIFSSHDNSHLHACFSHISPSFYQRECKKKSVYGQSIRCGSVKLDVLFYPSREVLAVFLCLNQVINISQSSPIFYIFSVALLFYIGFISFILLFILFILFSSCSGKYSLVTIVYWSLSGWACIIIFTLVKKGPKTTILSFTLIISEAVYGTAKLVIVTGL